MKHTPPTREDSRVVQFKGKAPHTTNLPHLQNMIIGDLFVGVDYVVSNLPFDMSGFSSVTILKQADGVFIVSFNEDNADHAPKTINIPPVLLLPFLEEWNILSEPQNMPLAYFIKAALIILQKISS